MSFKFGIGTVKGLTEMLAMSRISVELDSTALHVAAVCLGCTPCEAQERALLSTTIVIEITFLFALERLHAHCKIAVRST